jgi:hypothetical protein
MKSRRLIRPPRSRADAASLPVPSSHCTGLLQRNHQAVSAFGALVPAFSALFAFLLLGEWSSTSDWIGIAAVSMGVYLRVADQCPAYFRRASNHSARSCATRLWRSSSHAAMMPGSGQIPPATALFTELSRSFSCPSESRPFSRSCVGRQLGARSGRSRRVVSGSHRTHLKRSQ